MSNRNTAELVGIAAIICWLMLGLTGAALHFEPRRFARYEDMETLRTGVGLFGWLRRFHIWFAVPAAVLPIAAVASHYLQRRWFQLAGWVTGSFAMAASYYSGWFLPWGQMSMLALFHGTRMRGFRPQPPSSDGSSALPSPFEIFDIGEVSSPAIVFWYRMHIVVLPLILAAVATIQLASAMADRRARGDATGAESAS